MTEPSDPAAQTRNTHAVTMNPLTGMFQIPLTTASSCGASTGGFEVAPEDLNAVKADLDAALDELKLAARDADNFRHIRPPGLDEVSMETTDQIIRHLTEGSGSATQTVDDMRSWVEDFRNKIELAQREYQRIDEENEVKNR
ncbi:PE domain-containing protein [Saccharopolyspora sp. K220]|uniref:PE domain-containing protein n=1 Tax=Saccharopolyspora soli TaxID=2926618 RepID=UPI001F5847FF|nr:PE domain-containing protein [Saccharopolyspora soli]MCI2416022.1 PE domain-containing protein [Saccharopolyspora soli]